MSEDKRSLNLWLDGLGDKQSADLTLVCFGPAGSGASQFRSWSRLAPAWLRVLGVRLPGREFRYRETLQRDARALASVVADAIAAQNLQRFGFFGHSYGALLAFETARQLRVRGARQPCMLGIAGRPAPQLPHAHPKTYKLPEPEFIEVLRGYGGSDPRILDAPDLMAFFLPAIRADLEANAEYLYRPEAPLDMPILAVRGKQDLTCSSSELAAWREQTTGRCRLGEEEGGHFFYSQDPMPLIQMLSTALLQSSPESMAELLPST